MSPTPQVPPREEEYGALRGDQVVISGMAGLFPGSPNVRDFSNLLYDKVNPVSEEKVRWHLKHPELVDFSGKVSGLDRFDAQFFGIHYKLANNMDTMGRKVLEQTYQAIYDAGLSPNHLWGKNVSVYIGCNSSETDKCLFYNTKSKNDFVVPGCNRSMFANRISYWLNVKGPSMSIDESCCSSLAALNLAYNDMKRGDCEAAIVGGANLRLHPQTTIQCRQLLTKCSDGKTKSFDQNANGFALSEGVSVLFLQKAKDARRIYAEVIHVKNEFLSLLPGDDGPRFGYFRDPDSTANFIEKFYREANVSPQLVEYVEAFGSAVPEADKSELQAIEKVFCRNRSDPLLVGSVMSNIGHSGAASGFSAITKVLLGYHKGQLAANLHCESPRMDIASLNDGRMHILTEHEPFRRTYAAVNSMSLTGINAHVLLLGHYKPKDPTRYRSSIPRLVTISGRQESSVHKILDDLVSRPIDPEEVALLHCINNTRISGHLARGFSVLDSNENGTVGLSRKVDFFDNDRRQLWFVFSGMGSQWAGMGAQLMQIPIFAATIERCHKVLEPKGIDLVNVITSTDPEIFENILHSFVGISAIQFGLTDVLRALELEPDKIIGHSAGEVACAYADGCYTLEEAILVAYMRGWVSAQTPFIRGSMAAVGIGYQEMRNTCPPEIEIACHNGPDSCTLTGPADIMQEFVAELTSKNIFAKVVPSSNIAFHSSYISDAGPTLLKLLRDLIKNPKPRTARWLSTSIPQEKWDLPEANICSAEYQVNNMMSPVLFEEVLRLVPDDAVLLEIAPHGLLQAILKRSLSDSCRNIPLTRRGHNDSVVFLLESIGDLYMEGYNPKVQALYPTVEFPVSTNTPLLSHLVEWVHIERWFLPFYSSISMKSAAASKLMMSVHDSEHTYLRGHVIKGKMVYPFAAALVAAWDTLAMTLGVAKKELPVHFTDVHLYAQPALYEQRQLKLSVALHRGTGKFEITDEISKLATGFIIGTIPDVGKAYKRTFDESKEETFDANVVYQALSERDYSYCGAFRSINKVNKSLTEANIVWADNWVTFLDGILQFHMLRHPHNTVSQICLIRRLCIDVKEHTRNVLSNDDKNMTIRANVCDEQDYTRCGGVLLNNIRFRDLPLAVEEFELRNLKSIPNIHNANLSEGQELGVMLQSSRIGDLDSLTWVEGPKPIGSPVTVTVHYAGITTVDAERAMGVVPFTHKNTTYGMDFSGVTDSGERVMGIVNGGAASSRVPARPDLLWPVPEHWSLEDAATVPFAYAHAFYCLGVKMQGIHIKRILVHGGAGALGQAVISIALGLGYQVFTTVGDMNKKKFLHRLFPALKEDHIGNSRDYTFRDMVLNATNGEGCDLVLCNLKGNLKDISLNCCGLRGYVLDTAQLATKEDYRFGMYFLTRERNYLLSDFNSLFDNTGDIQRIRALMSEGIARGYVRPLTRVTYEPQDAVRAFRLLASSRHRGRVLLCLQRSLPSVHPRLTCASEGSHLIVCDDGLLGFQLTDKVISRGARNVYLNCKQLPNHLPLKIQSWQSLGINVKVSSDELKSTGDVTNCLKESAELGPVEGVYVAAINADTEKLQKLVANLDKESRNLCSSLRYFVVLSTSDSFGLQTYLARKQNQLPATLLALPVQKMNERDVDLSWYRTAVEATERALHSNSPVSVILHKQTKDPSLLQQLARVADIEIVEGTPTTATLGEQVSENAKLEAVSAFLTDVHGVYLSEEQIRSLTEERIKLLETSFSEPSSKQLKGLESFFSYVDSDELSTSAEMVFMRTLTHTDSEGDWFDVSQPYLCLVPGIEGHHQRFRTLCECLKLPALVLQPSLQHPHETLQQTAQRFAKVLLKDGGFKNNFYLLGYESGVLVALEIVSELERHGVTGTVFCLGGGPDEIIGEVNEQLREHRTEEELQDAVLRHMFVLISGASSADLKAAISGLDSWPSKLDACIRTLIGRVHHSTQYSRSLIDAAYSRITNVRNYTAQPRPLRSRIVLLRAALHSAPAPTSPKLHQYSQQPITVHHLKTDLPHAPADLQCAAIINENLHADILKAFDQKNTCETYINIANNFEEMDNLD